MLYHNHETNDLGLSTNQLIISWNVYARGKLYVELFVTRSVDTVLYITSLQLQN